MDGTRRLRAPPDRRASPVAAVSLRAELSSLATALDDLAGRITGIAEGLTGAEREALGPPLYEVERSLLAASRRLGKVVDESP